MVVARPVAHGRVAAPPSALEAPYVRRRDALLDLTLVLLASIVLPYLPSLLTTVGAEDIGMADIGPLVILQKWCEAGLAVGLLVYFVLRHGIRPATFGLRRDRIGQQLLWGVGTLAGVYAALVLSTIIVLALYMIFPELKSDLVKRVPFVNTMPVDSLVMTLTLLLAVAIHEEVVFRGLLLPYLRRVLGSWWLAGLASALIFAALHVPDQGLLAGGIQILCIAVVLTVFFVLSRSLLAVALAHLLFDFFQFQIVRLLPPPEELLKHFPG